MFDTYTPTIIKNVATRIDPLRTEQNLSMRDLAKKYGISLSDFFNFDDSIIRLRSKEAILIKIYRELSPMSQDTLIKVSKCMK